MDKRTRRNEIKMHVECVVISGATANAIKTAFDQWYQRGEPFGNWNEKVVISVTMFGVTDLLVFYWSPD